MIVYENKTDLKTPVNPPDTPPRRDDFSHIDGDAEDFIFSFTDNKKHSEK